jgi:hypothetical protein
LHPQRGPAAGPDASHPETARAADHMNAPRRRDLNVPRRNAKKHQEQLLDEALKESLPASDPPSIALPDRRRKSN